MLNLFLFAVIAAALTLWLPKRALAIWLILFWGGNIALWHAIDFTDDPALLSASIIFGPFWLLNCPATIGRLGLIAVQLNDTATRGYRG